MVGATVSSNYTVASMLQCDTLMSGSTLLTDFQPVAPLREDFVTLTDFDPMFSDFNLGWAQDDVNFLEASQESLFWVSISRTRSMTHQLILYRGQDNPAVSQARSTSGHKLTA
jgi:hypothetical protein